MRLLCGEIQRIDPARIVIDSLSEMRLLAQNPLRYRRQVFALKHFLGARHATVLMIDDVTSESHDFQLRSIVHASSLCRSWRSTLARSGDGCA
jgi:circadian clock protein KaiC